MSNERESLQVIAGLYQHESLAGINEALHVAVRDAVIPAAGGESALEIGCGAGLWTTVLCQKYPQVDVVDASPLLLNHVKGLCAHSPATLDCHEAMIEAFRPPEGKKWFHIYLTFLIEHLVDPISVLKMIKPWLLPDGAIFVAVPNANSFHRELAVRMGMLQSVHELSDNDKRLGHRRVYTMDLLTDHVVKAGYVVQEQYYVGFKPLSLAQMQDYPPDLIKALCGGGDLAGKHAAYIGAKARI